MNDTMAFTKTPRQLFLLEVHDTHQVRENRGRFPRWLQIIEERELLWVDPNVRKYMPTDAVNLWHSQHMTERIIAHAPQTLLKHLGVDRFCHLVLTNHAMWPKYLSQSGAQKLSA